MLPVCFSTLGFDLSRMLLALVVYRRRRSTSRQWWGLVQRGHAQQSCDALHPALQRFHFLGGLDCPDWLLGEIASFSRISPVGIRSWCAAVVEHLKYPGLLQWSDDTLHKLRDQCSIELRSLKAMIAALAFIFEKAAKHECPAGDLEKELLQLGFPPEHVSEIATVYSSERDALHRALTKTFIRAPSINEVRALSGQPSADQRPISLQLKTSDGESLALNVSAEQITGIRNGIREALTSLETFVGDRERE